MVLTPLEEIEASAHDKFGGKVPSKKELGDFLDPIIPKMDGGVSIALGIATLIITGWQAWEQHVAIRLQQGGTCPVDGLPAIKIKNRKYICKNDHKW